MEVQEKRFVFLIDDEPIQNEMLKDFLADRFLSHIKTFDNGEEAMKEMHLGPEVIVLDYHLNAHDKSAKNGVEVLKMIKDNYPKVEVIMLSGQDKIEVAVESMKYGAYDYVLKGETAFSRIENIMNNISELHKIKSINNAYKRTIIYLGIGLSIFIAATLWFMFYRTF
ncbi:MAG: response regulator [Chitinophagia bacterium]|jgi:two-component system, OmpR family, response regulator|nr:response regulator [Chitinophagia bacterium]